jgi:hypothetical protein
MSFNNPIRRFFDVTAGGASAGDVQNQEEFNAELRITNNTLISIANNLTEQLKTQKELGKEVEKTNEDYYKDLTKTLKAASKESFTLAENAEALSRGALRSKTVTDQLLKSERERNKAIIQYQLLEEDGVKLGEKALQDKEAALAALDKTINKFKAQVFEAKKLEKTAGLTAKIFEGIKDIPLLNKFIDIDKVTEDIYETANKTGSSWKSFGTGLSSSLEQLTSKLKDPLTQITLLAAFYGKIIKAAYSHNELLTKTGNLLGASKEEARGLYEESFKYSTTAHNSFITAERLLESQIKLNTTLGTSVNLGDKNAEAFARLNHFYGLSEESAGKLVELGVEQGKNGIDILNTTGKTFGIQKAQYGGTLALNKVLDKVANVSSDIYVNFKGNTESIARSVMNADRLGLSLDKVSQIGESLLNFESSIENELKAELLTGKQLNLEKAREYALSGDIENLTKEISKQVGGIHEFEKMNVIQRKAYAEAMGMSVQEMSTMLRKQEFEAKLAGTTAKSAKEKLEYAEKNGIKIDDALKQQYEQKSLADEQKEVFEKINSIIGKITEGPMAKFLEIIEKVLHKVNGLFEAFGKFTGGIAGDALGAVLLGAPLLIGATRLLTGGIKSMLVGARGATPANPQYVYDTAGGGTGAGGAGGGIMDIISGGKGTAGKRALVKRFGSAGAAKLAMKGLKGGGIAAALGLGTELVAGQMEDGGAKDVVSGLGQTASYAGTGAMIGSVIPGIGTAVGAIVGGGIGLIKSFFDAEDSRKERETQDRKSSEEQMKKTTDLLNQLAVRPINLNVGGKTIMEYNTASDLFGTQNSSFK